MEAVQDESVSVRFWRKDRDLASVTFYVRKIGAASIDYLILPSVYAAGVNRPWNRGLCRQTLHPHLKGGLGF